MKCPACESVGLRSTVHAGGTMTTLLCSQNYFDEDGQPHFHDPNWRHATWTCSKGHSGDIQELPGCPSCGYGRGTRRVQVTEHEKEKQP